MYLTYKLMMFILDESSGAAAASFYSSIMIGRKITNIMCLELAAVYLLEIKAVQSIINIEVAMIAVFTNTAACIVK